MTLTRKEIRKQVRDQKKIAKVEHFNTKSSPANKTDGTSNGNGGRLGQLANNIKNKQVQLSQQNQTIAKEKSKGVSFDVSKNKTQLFNKSESPSSVKPIRNEKLSTSTMRKEKVEKPKKMSKLAQMAAAMGHGDADTGHDSEEGDLNDPVDIDDDDDGKLTFGTVICVVAILLVHYADIYLVLFHYFR